MLANMQMRKTPAKRVLLTATLAKTLLVIARPVPLVRVLTWLTLKTVSLARSRLVC